MTVTDTTPSSSDVDWTNVQPGIEKLLECLNFMFKNDDFDMYLGMKYDFLDRSMFQNQFITKIKNNFQK